MTDSGNPPQNKHIASPFIPDVLDKGDARYPAHDIFAGGIRESAGGYISECSTNLSNIIPTVNHPPQPDIKSDTESDTVTEEASEHNTPLFDESALEDAKKTAFEDGKKEGLAEAERLHAAYIEEHQALIDGLTQHLSDAVKALESSLSDIQKETAHTLASALRHFFQDLNKNDDQRVALLHSILQKEIAALNKRLPTRLIIAVSPYDKNLLEKNFTLNNKNYHIEEDMTLHTGEAKLITNNGHITINADNILDMFFNCLTD